MDKRKKQPDIDLTESSDCGKRNGLDLISRQDAIDALQKEINKGIPPFDDVMGSIRCGVRLARNIIEDLPSAEPEIIYCGDCKYKDDGIDEDGIPFLKCLNGRSYGGTRINDYCSWAERRTDE